MSYAKFHGVMIAILLGASSAQALTSRFAALTIGLPDSGRLSIDGVAHNGRSLAAPEIGDGGRHPGAIAFAPSGGAPTSDAPAWQPTIGALQSLNGGVYALAVFDDGLGGGSALFAGGWFLAPSGDLYIAKWGCPSAGILGDLNGDGVVNGADLALLLGAWGPCTACPADFSGDGIVGSANLAILLGAWSS